MAIAIHRGAIDNTTVTQRPPNEVMTQIRGILDSIGICVQPESSFRFRCIRPSQSSYASEVSHETNEPVMYPFDQVVSNSDRFPVAGHRRGYGQHYICQKHF